MPPVMGTPPTSPREGHPLFAPTPTQTHPLPLPPRGEVRIPRFLPDDYEPIRSKFAPFGDYDDEDGDEVDFDLDFPIAGTIAKRRARTKGQSQEELYKLQWHQQAHEIALKYKALADVDTSLKPIDWNSVSGGFQGEHKYAFEEVSPGSLFPALQPLAEALAAEESSTEAPAAEVPANDVEEKQGGEGERRQVRKAKLAAIEKIKVATARRTRPDKQSAKVPKLSPSDLIDLTTPLGKDDKAVDSTTATENESVGPKHKKRKTN